MLSEAGNIEDLVTSHERQLSQLAHLSDDSATLRQTRELLQVSLTWLQVAITFVFPAQTLLIFPLSMKIIGTVINKFL